MSAVVICMEGGGRSARAKDALRRGMDVFLGDLKNEVRKRRWRWRLVACGGRREAYEAFRRACEHAREGEITILLVDAEAPVTAPTPAEHLRTRPGDGWDLTGLPGENVHLMVQIMETWIVADPDALAAYYGQHFNGNALPGTDDLETVAKDTVADALERATRRTRKGRYHKMRHAAGLLARIDPAKARQRCRHCARLFDTLGTAVAAG